MTDLERIVAQLSRDRPNWAIDWAGEHELREMALGQLSQEALKKVMASKLFPWIINAAIEAGVVKLVEGAKDE